jgi:hypothetical protein
MRTSRRAARHSLKPTSERGATLDSSRGSRRRPHRLRAIVTAWLTLYAAVALVIGGSSGASAAEPASDLQLLGRLPAASGTDVFVDEPTHRIIIFSVGLDGVATIKIVNGDTFQVVEEKKLDFTIGYQGYAPATWTWDSRSRRLYLIGYATSLDYAGSTNPMLKVLDASMNVVATHPLTAFQPGVSIVGMSYFAPTNRLELVAQVSDPLHLLGTQNVQVNEVDPSTGAGTLPSAYSVPSCEKAVGDHVQAAVVRSTVEPVIFVGCGTGNVIVLGQPGVPGVAAVNIANPAAPTSTLYPLAGDYAQGESVYDAQARRFVMLASGPNVSVQSARIFDMDRRVFLGTVGAGNSNVYATAVDPVGGRLYVSVEGALMVGSHEGMSIPQAQRYVIPQPAYGPIVPIRFNHSLLIMTASDPLVFNIYRNPANDYVTPADANPDAATTGGPEVPGKTDVNFSGDGRAFGSRVLEIAGVNGALQNIYNFQGDYWTYDPTLTGRGKPAGLNDGDRDLYFARVNRAFLSQNEASATAISMDGDANTRSDWDTATKPPNLADPTKPSPAPGQPWPSKPSACVDNGAGTQKDTSDETATACDKKDATVSVTAIHEKDTTVSGGGSDLLKIGSSSSRISLGRDPKGGMITTTTAEAKNVVIGGVASFGDITSVATARSHGQRGTAAADYKRTFENVTIGTFHCDQCDPQTVVTQANAALGSKFLFELPLEEKIATPGGVLGAAQRDRWQHQQDHVIIDQPLTETQIPALRVTYVNDNKQTSRLVLEFAASQSDASYAIYKVDDSSFDAGDEAAVPADDASGSLDVAAAPTDDSGSLGSTAGPAQEDQPSSDDGNVIQRFVRRLGHGLRLLLTGKHHTLLNLLLWTLLATPVFLATRRRYLLQLIGEYRS